MVSTRDGGSGLEVSLDGSGDEVLDVETAGAVEFVTIWRLTWRGK